MVSSRLIAIYIISLSSHANALPIGFGYNQGSREFNETTSKDFIVYQDTRASHDARLAIQSLIAAKPHMERWFNIKRSSPLIVNMSAISDNASFANFVTDSIELQTMGQGTRDLAWHEYTHSTMYQQLDNFLGPAGTILHLAWMEAWFLEGLAEALSVSIGSNEQAGVERFQALTKDWPTWDRIHSLYTSGPFSYRGYATSGAFVAWLLRTYDANRLGEVLRKFRDDSMPWWWPWALTPFNDFWPMDTMLKEWTGENGKQLYERYKNAAQNFWQKKFPRFKPSNSDFKLSASSGYFWENGTLFGIGRDDDHLAIRSLKIDRTDGRIAGWDRTIEKIAPYDDPTSRAIATHNHSAAYISRTAGAVSKAVINYNDGKKIKRLTLTAQRVSGVWLSKSDVWWLEQDIEHSRLCYVPRLSFAGQNKTCMLDVQTPVHIMDIGERRDAENLTEDLWIRSTLQALHGDHYEIKVLNTASRSVKAFPLLQPGMPLALTFTTTRQPWILMGDRSQRYMQQFSEDGVCLRSTLLPTMPVGLVFVGEEVPWLSNYYGDHYRISRLQADQQFVKQCPQLNKHASPLLAALNSKTELSLKDALTQASIWSEESREQDNGNCSHFIGNPKTTKICTDEWSTAKTDPSASDDPITTQPAKWRGRPVFAFPWIGADDALGPQLGVISVPLMDHQQNETLRATVLVGMYSRYPYQELAITSNRWTPTWTLAVSRSQTYNGRYLDKEKNQIYSSYLDEKGVRVDGNFQREWRRNVYMELTGGVRVGHLARYIGEASHVGTYNEMYAGIANSWLFSEHWSWNMNVRSRVAPKDVNENFNYNILGAATDVKRTIGDGSVRLGVEAERTRGPYRRDLQEMYMPLKTFVPGSGGGYNKNSYAFTADEGLFSPVFGDTQGRLKLDATHPVIKDFDKFLGLVYIDRLDLSGFVNHGTAWRGDKLPDKKTFLTAHGYNLDLQMDNKGVRFNSGVGVGQLIGKPWQIYFTAGFDALF